MGGGQEERAEPPTPVLVRDEDGETDPAPEMDAKEEAVSEPDEEPYQDDGVRAPSPSEEGDAADPPPPDEPPEPPPAAPGAGGAENENLQDQFFQVPQDQFFQAPQGPRRRINSAPIIDSDIRHREVRFRGNYDETARRGRRGRK